MNIADKHNEKPVSAYPLFKGEIGSTTAIHIKKGEQLKEHVTKTKACLICISGFARFENEKGEIHQLKSGDYVLIEPLIKHWVDGIGDCQLILIK